MHCRARALRRGRSLSSIKRPAFLSLSANSFSLSPRQSVFILGTLISQIRFLEAVIHPCIVAFQTLPKVAIAPLILIWVGLGMEGKIFIAATASFFPMLANTIVGLRSAPQNEIDLMRSLSAIRWKIFRYVQLPEALPFIFAGLNIGLVLAVLGAIVGQFLGAKFSDHCAGRV